MSDVVVARPAQPSEWTAAFRLVFEPLGRAECERRTGNALRLVHSGEIAPDGIFVVPGRGQLLASIVCVALPGASGLIWPPGCAEPGRTDLEDALLHHGNTWLRGRGVKLAQCLLAPQEAFLSSPLLRQGYRFITQLWYMRHDLSLLPQQDRPDRLTLFAYDGSARFHHTLEQTYEQSQDCPEINGVRSLEEVLEGHRSQGRFDPGRWWLACAGGEPVGVLLLTELPESGDWEVAYVGIVPAARQRGFGCELLGHALRAARAAAAPEVVLSVDVRNEPAWHLYRGLGFRPAEQRLVYLAIWR
jgi:ribosomal protein S18 acetylase RimI-like enzyme